MTASGQGGEYLAKLHKMMPMQMADQQQQMFKHGEDQILQLKVFFILRI